MYISASMRTYSTVSTMEAFAVRYTAWNIL
jgi:hypothetical protein